MQVVLMYCQIYQPVDWHGSLQIIKARSVTKNEVFLAPYYAYLSLVTARWLRLIFRQVISSCALAHNKIELTHEENDVDDRNWTHEISVMRLQCQPLNLTGIELYLESLILDSQ